MIVICISAFYCVGVNFIINMSEQIIMSYKMELIKYLNDDAGSFL